MIIKPASILFLLLILFSQIAKCNELEKKDDYSHNFRSSLFGNFAFVIGAIDFGPLGGGGVSLEYLAYKNLWVGGYFEGSGAIGTGLIHGGPLLRLRLPFAHAPLSWLISARGGIGRHFTKLYSGDSLFGLIQTSLLGLEWTFAKAMSLTFIVPTPNLLFGSFGGPVISSGLEIWFNYSW